LFDDEVSEVVSRIWSRRQDGDTAAVELRLVRGTRVVAVFAAGAADEDRLDVLGDRGSARFDRLRGMLEFGARAFEYGRHNNLRREIVGVAAALRRAIRPPVEPSYMLAMSAFVNAIRQGEPVQPGLADGLRSLEVVDAAMRAALSGAAVRLHSTTVAAADAS
ncbi:MAG: Gfo/Idh/MocA family oxidoreductase, partial [Gemmatimonadetes bacterium]|nr:Gfo/Idh/MocA family oxidoreductase [Gemmatimonadota bacterium]